MQPTNPTNKQLTSGTATSTVTCGVCGASGSNSADTGTPGSCPSALSAAGRVTARVTTALQPPRHSVPRGPIVMLEKPGGTWSILHRFVVERLIG